MTQDVSDLINRLRLLRADGPRPRLDLIRAGVPRTAHARWRPAGTGPADAGASAGGDR